MRKLQKNPMLRDIHLKENESSKCEFCTKIFSEKKAYADTLLEFMKERSHLIANIATRISYKGSIR